jgi:integrase
MNDEEQVPQAGTLAAAADAKQTPVERLEALGVRGILWQLARDGQIIDVRCEMPQLKPSERPRPADDARERRVLTDDELAHVLDACGERERLYFRTLAETGARMGEVLGLTRRRIDSDTVTFAEQLARGGELAPLKTRTSRRTIEATRSLAAALALAGGRERIFGHLTHASSTTRGDARSSAPVSPTRSPRFTTCATRTSRA